MTATSTFRLQRSCSSSPEWRMFSVHGPTKKSQLSQHMYHHNNNKTTVLWPLHRSTCISWQLQLRTGGFCRCKVLLPACLADGNQHILIREKTLEFSSTKLSILPPYLSMCTVTGTKLSTSIPQSTAYYFFQQYLLQT